MNKLEPKLLMASLACITSVLLGHNAGNKLLVTIGLISIIALVLVSYKKNFINLMLLLLPFSTVLKLNQGSMSVYTVISILVFIALGMELKTRYDLRSVLIAGCLATGALSSKLLLGNDLSMSFFTFFLFLVLIPSYIKYHGEDIDFEKSAVYLATGVLAASFLSILFKNSPGLISYINVYEWQKADITRLSGFYGDANYYSAQVLVAISALLVILINIRSKYKPFVSSLIVGLIYYGSLSVSKSFIILLSLILILWLIAVMFSKISIKQKLAIYIITSFIIIYIATNGILTEQISMYSTRFGMITDASTLSTGRSLIYENYLRYISSNKILLSFGQGLSSIYQYELQGRASHNTLIQMIYQIGLFGTAIMALWLKRLSLLTSKTRNKYGLSGGVQAAMLVIGCIGPWLALDMMFFDDFFYILVVLIIGLQYIRTNQSPLDKVA